VRDHPRGGRPCPPQRWREHLNAALYVLRTGCAWRHLPHHFTVSWSAAHKHFLRWCRTGVWFKALAAVRGEVRARADRRKRPSAAVMDSSSVKASPALLRKAKRVEPTIAHLWLDKGHTGHTVAESATQAGVSIDVVSGPKPANGFQVQPRRWVVERTNGWINHCRRLDRHYEVTLTAHEGFLCLSQIAQLLRRLDRTQLFDTH